MAACTDASEQTALLEEGQRMYAEKPTLTCVPTAAHRVWHRRLLSAMASACTATTTTPIYTAVYIYIYYIRNIILYIAHRMRGDPPADRATRGTSALATWSQEEYANLGLQREYLRFKSIQRFTETWALLERASKRGLFAPQLAASAAAEDLDSDDGGGGGGGGGGDGGGHGVEPLRVGSVGGGPGFELYAMEKWFESFCPALPLHVRAHPVTLDCPSCAR
jgi:hypothetical protein